MSNVKTEKSKITVYLPESTLNDIQDLSRLKRMSLTSYVTSIIESAIEKEQERLAQFRSLAGE